MAIDILVPPLSQTMDSVILVEWLKSVGDSILKGEILFRIETDKAVLEIESPGTGILREILVEQGSEVKVRSKIGIITAVGEEPPIPSAATRRGQPIDAIMVPERSPRAEANVTGPYGQSLPAERQHRVLVSPRARRMAQLKGVPLDQVSPSGPDGAIIERDVAAFLATMESAPKVTPVARRVAEQEGVDLAALAQSKPGVTITRAVVESALEDRAVAEIDVAQKRATPLREPVLADSAVSIHKVSRSVELTPTRRTIARRMQHSHQTSAPVTLTREVDATELVLLREGIINELDEQETRPSITDFLIGIVARCLASHPHLNGTFDDEALEISEVVNIALAVDTDRGLIVPVMHDVEGKGVLELGRLRADLVRRAIDGIVTPDELHGGTFTITNLGTLGVDAFTPIINPPQIAILGIGRIRPAPAVFKDRVTVRQMMYLCLTFDHRIVDGAPAARFLQDIVRLIEKPYLVWL